MWSIERDKVRAFAGLKDNPSGIAIGPDEEIAGADFSKLTTAKPEVVEELAIE
jgi:hypothetical protein